MKKPWIPAAVGGGIGGLIDIVYAMVLWGVILADQTQMTPVTVLQSVASGLLGKQAFAGGLGAAALGLALHFLIAFCMALAYVLAGRKLPVLTARPLLMGVLYGFVLFAIMNFVVVPLSAIGWRPMSWVGALRALIPHVIFVGPVIAWAAAVRKRSQAP
jgi:hypothetical protein